MFKVSPPGNAEERVRVSEYPMDYLGKYLRVEYAIITADGIPFHGVATDWRDKEDE